MGQAESAFHTTIDSYRLATGRVAYANTTAPSLPASVASSVEAVVGLDDLLQVKPQPEPSGPTPSDAPNLSGHPALNELKGAVPQRSVAPTNTGSRPAVPARPTVAQVGAAEGPSPCSAAVTDAEDNDGYTAPDLAQAYSLNGLYNSGDLGKGVTIGVFEADTYLTSDISTFQSCYGTNTSITNISVDGGGGNSEGSGEETLDIENAIEFAPQANLDVYDIPSASYFTEALDEYNEIETQDTAQVISSSYGFCEALMTAPAIGGPEASAENTVFQEMAAQGQSVLVASGDTGSEGCAPHNSAITLPVGTDPIGIATDTTNGTSYVANYGSANVSVFSESEPGVVSTPTVGTEPYGVGVDSTTGNVYVANAGSNSVSVIDAATCNGSTQSNCTPSTITSSSLDMPAGVATNPTTGTVYVTDYGSGTVSVISESTQSVVGTVTLASSAAEPIAATLDPTTHQLFVADFNAGNVSVINTTSCNASTKTGCTAIPPTVTVGSDPDAIGVDTVHDAVYVANEGSSSVSVISGNTDTVSATITGTNVPSEPTGVAVAPSGAYAIVDGTYDGTNENYEGAGVAAVVSGTSDQVTTLLGAVNEPEGVSIDSTAGYVLTADEGDDTASLMGIRLEVEDPASQPYVTAVGGTDLTNDATSPPTESTWNESLNATFDWPEGAGTGGISENWPMPSYQDGIINSQSSGTPCGATTGDCREVPDVAAEADWVNGYVVYIDGTWDTNGGTSAATPFWAALVALAESSVSPVKGLGLLNPALYGLPSTDFNKISVGNNDYTTTNGGQYAAGGNYNMATGLGSPIGTSIAAGLVSTAVAPTLSAISPNEGPASGNVQVTLSGTGFSTTSGATTVKFGSTAATAVICSSTTSCTATEPAGTAGTASVTVAVGGQTSGGVSFTYYTPGLLRVTTSPALASQITVDGNISDTWGLTWAKEPPGSHTVCFAAVQGYITPACQSVTVASGVTTTVTGTFTERGFLHVTTSPAVNSKITYTPSGSTALPMDNYGAWTDIPVGTYSVCFGAVAGYSAPACQSATVTAGATTNITGTFTVNSGATGPTGVGLLRVTTSPAVPSQITVDGNITDTWGLNWLQIAPGSHTVCFSSVQGYTTPACQTVTVASGATTTVTGTFTQRGFLQVETSPAVAGTIYVNGTPADDWGYYTDLPAGTYTVCFGAVAGETAPACQTPTVTAGTTTTITGTY